MVGGTCILHLSKLNKIFRDFMETMALYKSFSDIGQSLLELTKSILPIESFECYAETETGSMLHICEENMFHGVEAEMI